MAAVFINVTAFINVAARPGFLYGSSPRTAQPASTSRRDHGNRGDHGNHGKIPVAGIAVTIGRGREINDSFSYLLTRQAHTVLVPSCPVKI